jgi:molecular chaperone GrpE
VPQGQRFDPNLHQAMFEVPTRALSGPSALARASAGTFSRARRTLSAALSMSRALKDKLLRTLADMENLRRRTEREVADARTYAVTNFAPSALARASAGTFSRARRTLSAALSMSRAKLVTA